ncbi:hypothetical protein J116_015115 [Streptomyces thermolilacinus SPC6]|uniref:Uncharacterized protein n=1 Tax=Streptomyces thermolilacinus SPC6 TaxID=1306406 RepID=A0A1D3DTF3_9ACTN|nr:hypothetical protein J116_015115 [Streptomyces thermolilacinus SPC6]
MLAALVAVLGCMTGCTSTDGTVTVTSRSATAPSPDPSAPASNAPAPDVSAPRVPAPSLPEVVPGFVRLASGGPRRGSADLGRIVVGRGTTWVNIHCVADSGTRRLKVTVGEVAEFGVACGGSESGTYANRLDLSEGGTGRFRVEAPHDVRWTADVQGERTSRG